MCIEKQTEESIQEPVEIKKDKIEGIKLPMETNKLNSYIALSQGLLSFLQFSFEGYKQGGCE